MMMMMMITNDYSLVGVDITFGVVVVGVAAPDSDDSAAAAVLDRYSYCQFC